MSKQSSELKINKTYLRENAEGFSLAPKGEEQDIEFNKCNYYTDKKGTSSLQYIVQTYSVGNFENTLAKMILPESGDISQLRGPGVSVHYIIDQKGEIYQLVPDNKRPWACGVGTLKSGSKLNPDIPNEVMINDMNSFGISIMSINNGKNPLTQPQFESNLLLTEHLVKTYDIKGGKVIGLADWTPGRHIAPGPYFPWQEFSKAGLGLWSDIERKEDPEVIVSYKQKPLLEEVTHIQQAFEELLKKYSKGGLAEEVVKKYNLSSLNLREDLSSSVLQDIDIALTRGLGYVGKVGGQEGYLDSATLSCMLSFNLHHLGQQILAGPLADVYNDGLWVDSSNTEARGLLGSWTTNSQDILDSFLDS